MICILTQLNKTKQFSIFKVSLVLQHKGPYQQLFGKSFSIRKEINLENIGNQKNK